MKHKISMVVGVFHDTYLWLKHAKDLDYKIIATHPIDIESKFYYSNVKKYIDKFYKVSYSDVDKLLEIATTHDVSMLIPHPSSNDATVSAGFVNSQLGLKGVSYESALLASSKYDFHKLLVKNDLPRPEFTTKYIDKENITYPCIVKPNYGAGSVGVKLIHTEQELRSFFINPDIKNGYELTKPKYDYYIIQEYIDGPKIMGCHAVVHNKKLTIFGRTYRDLIKERDAKPYFYGQEFITTRDPITPYTYNQIEKVVEAVGIDNTPFDLEVLLDENDNAMSFIEFNLRPAEKAFNFINGRGGYEYCIREQVKLGTDLPCDFSEKRAATDDYVGVRYFRFKEGKINSIKWPDLPTNTLFFDTNLTDGSVIESIWNVNAAMKNGSIIVTEKSREKVCNSINEFVDKIQIKYYGG
jgi:hypothetical protein